MALNLKPNKLYTEELKALYWKQVEIKRERQMRKIRPLIQKGFDIERVAIKKAWSDVLSGDRMITVAQEIIGREDNQERWKGIYRKCWIETAKIFGEETYRVLVEKKAEHVFVNVFEEEVNNYVNTISAKRVKLVSHTTKEQIARVVKKGLSEGLSIPNIKTGIDNLYLEQIIPNRSTTIARTETISASNYGSYAGARLADVEIYKKWLPTPGERTRDTHADMAHHPSIRMDEWFRVGVDMMMYPADPTGSAENVINCRCTLIYVERRGI